jgi:ribose-phosphate pyrophosphokinase
MSLSKPTSLGIIACPGTEFFAADIVANIKQLFVKKTKRKSAVIAKKYKLETKEVIRQHNFTIDMHSPLVDGDGPIDTIAVPPFTIDTRFTRFANGEFKAEILNSVRGVDVYILQDVENHDPLTFYNDECSYSLSVNDHVMLLFATIDAAFQASARSVTVVVPAYPFARQHQKKGREALTASWFGRTLEFMGVVRIITLDIHSKEIENSFNRLRLENLHASYQTVKKLAELVDLQSTDLVVVSPDTGAVDRNKYYAGNLKRPLALLYKERDYSKLTRNADENNITKMRLLGSVRGKTVFMADDILGSGGTLIKAMKYLKEQGAVSIIAAVSLPLFTGEAVRFFDEAYEKGYFYRIIGTNAVHHDGKLLDKDWYVSANISNLFGRVIYRNHHERSLSSLLDDSEMIQLLLRD